MTGLEKLTHRRSQRRLVSLLALSLALTLTLTVYLIARAHQPAPEAPGRAASDDKQHFLIVLKGARPTLLEDITPAEQEIVSHHFALLEEAERQGKISLVGRCDDTPLGLIVVQVASREEAQEILNNDPAVRAGIMRGELHPFTLYMGSLLPD